jgi:hypothetical protein
VKRPLAADALTQYCRDILEILEKRESINSLELASLLSAPHQDVIGEPRALNRDFVYVAF